MASMSDVMGLVFSNMHDSCITELTEQRTMASVPFGGRYRLIDFMLSNMVNSGVTDAGVITKSNYQSLLDHLSSGQEWDLARKTGGLKLLPPFGHAGSGIYRGRMEALAGVQEYIRRNDADYVILADSNVIANMDLKPFVEFHKKRQADITVVYGRQYCTKEESKSKLVLFCDENDRVFDVLTGPEINGEINVALNIYVMNKKFLQTLIVEAACRNQYSFEKDILQKKLREFKVLAYKYQGYFAQIDSMKVFFKSNFDLLNSDIRTELFKVDSPIYTKVRDEPPAKYGIGASVRNSLMADGCIIEGKVENSIIFRGVKIEKDSIIKNSIIMQGSVIKQGSDINYAVLDKTVHVSEGSRLTGTADYPVFIKKAAKV
ncbi:MAG: glucose-1-phosphate adenylyltransferase subunit GlgD [Clostridiales bacterium]|nr:glucose-1-phosphate adenylyltransferase subunit GlgD [Clostridiales bacterium]